MSIDFLNPAIFLLSLVVISLLVGVLVGRALWGPGQQDMKSTEAGASSAPKFSESPDPAELSIAELVGEIEEAAKRLVSRRN